MCRDNIYNAGEEQSNFVLEKTHGDYLMQLLKNDHSVDNTMRRTIKAAAYTSQCDCSPRVVEFLEDFDLAEPMVACNVMQTVDTPLFPAIAITH